MLTCVYRFKLTRGIFVTDAWWRIRGCSASGLTALSFSCTSAPEPGNQNHQIPERGVGDITDHVPTCLPQPQLDLCWITPGWVTWPRVSAAVNLLGVRFIASFPPEKRHRFPLSFLALWPLFEVTGDKKGHLKRTDWNFFCISTQLSIVVVFKFLLCNICSSCDLRKRNFQLRVLLLCVWFEILHQPDVGLEHSVLFVCIHNFGSRDERLNFDSITSPSVCSSPS